MQFYLIFICINISQILAEDVIAEEKSPYYLKKIKGI